VQFFKNFLRNLFLLLVLGVVVYLISPEIMESVYKAFGQLFGPLAIIMVIVTAIPRRRT